MDNETFFIELALFINSEEVRKIFEEYELEKKRIPYVPITSPVTPPARMEQRVYQRVNNDPRRNLQMLFDIRDEERRRNGNPYQLPPACYNCGTRISFGRWNRPREHICNTSGFNEGNRNL